MTAADAPWGLAKIWAGLQWRVGYTLDGIARRLMVHAPAVARSYAYLIASKGPQLRPYPGWTFATEYYPELRWMVWRRATLWDVARERGMLFPLDVRWYGGMTVGVTLGNDQSMCLYVCGSFEPNEFAFLHKVLGPDMVVIDAGANEGLYTLFAAACVGAGGRVVAVEPSSRERANLQGNIDRNHLKNVTVVDSALGEAAGRAQLQIAPGLHAGHNTLGAFVYDEVTAENAELVAVETLDSLVDRLALSRVDFIKIDVEGAEGAVLAGAGDVLKRLRPLLLLEANASTLEVQGTGTFALMAMLRSQFGYEILVFSPLTGRVERQQEGSEISPNILAVPAERVSELLAKA